MLNYFIFHLHHSNLFFYLKLNFKEIISTNSEFDSIIIDYSPKSYGFIKSISDLDSSIDICDPKISFEENLKFPRQIRYGMSGKRGYL